MRNITLFFKPRFMYKIPNYFIKIFIQTLYILIIYVYIYNVLYIHLHIFYINIIYNTHTHHLFNAFNLLKKQSIRPKVH